MYQSIRMHRKKWEYLKKLLETAKNKPLKNENYLFPSIWECKIKNRVIAIPGINSVNVLDIQKMYNLTYFSYNLNHLKNDN